MTESIDGARLLLMNEKLNCVSRVLIELIKQLALDNKLNETGIATLTKEMQKLNDFTDKYEKLISP